MTTATATDNFAESDLLDSAEEARAARLTEAFMSETAPLGSFEIRKPCMAGITILTQARNKFVCGFNEQEIRAMFPNGADPAACKKSGQAFIIDQVEILQHLDDVWELYLIGRATIEEKRLWYTDREAFRSACFDFLATAERIPRADIEQMLVDALLLSNETAEAQVKSIPSKTKTVKKKGPRHPPSS